MGRLLKKIEFSLIIGLVFAVMAGAWAQKSQRELSGKLLRLHVVANSDETDDQQLKLAVRDKVLEYAAPLLSGVTDAEEAERIITANLPIITEQARLETLALGYDYAVNAELREEVFPAREYDSFTLPAGAYRALRVTIGEGSGQNWWCVVFPPLCGDGDFYSTAKEAGLSDSEIALITDGDGVVFKFKVVEIFEKLRNWFR